ncbi:MAG: response regulator receiver protein [Myxococcales bacterium]|nr:response regulator receiver protein [Myxococcales bacterium]
MPSPRPSVLVIHGDGDVLDLLTRWFESASFDVMTAVTAFRAQSQLEGSRPIDAVVAPWDATNAVGGEVYRWSMQHRIDLRTQFVFVADEVPPEFDALVGGRCLAVPLSAPAEIVRVAQAAIARRSRIDQPAVIETGERPTLLLADDDPILLDVMADLLTESGYAVSPVESGNSATSILEREDFDVIVTDWHMHDGSGADLYRWILKRKPHLAARVVFLSVADQDDSGPVAPGRPMFRKGQDSQALIEMLREIVKQVRG